MKIWLFRYWLIPKQLLLGIAYTKKAPFGYLRYFGQYLVFFLEFFVVSLLVGLFCTSVVDEWWWYVSRVNSCWHWCPVRFSLQWETWIFGCCQVGSGWAFPGFFLVLVHVGLFCTRVVKEWWWNVARVKKKLLVLVCGEILAVVREGRAIQKSQKQA